EPPAPLGERLKLSEHQRRRRAPFAGRPVPLAARKQLSDPDRESAVIHSRNVIAVWYDDPRGSGSAGRARQGPPIFNCNPWSKRMNAKLIGGGIVAVVAVAAGVYFGVLRGGGSGDAAAAKERADKVFAVMKERGGDFTYKSAEAPSGGLVL